MPTKQVWLAAVGSSEQPLANWWINESPELLTGWPVGSKTRSGIEMGALLVYYAAHHQRLIAIARATASGSSAIGVLPVQDRLVIPSIKAAPSYDVLGKSPQVIMGMTAMELTPDEYEKARQALLDALRARTELAS